MEQLLQEAYQRFEAFREVLKTRGLREADAMTLSTCSASGRPTSRVVLLRGHDAEGFVFYTNSLSRKGRQLAENPYAAICFYDDQGAQQVLIDGKVERLDDQVTDRYWNSRARESRIGAWASTQSEVLPDRATLEQRVADYEQMFVDVVDVPRPEHWFGFCLVPERIEFWQGRLARLHERDVYELQNSHWVKYHLYP